MYIEVCERIWNVHDVCLAYTPNVRMRAYDHALAYVEAIRCSVTALLLCGLLYCVPFNNRKKPICVPIYIKKNTVYRYY